MEDLTVVSTFVAKEYLLHNSTETINLDKEINDILQEDISFFSCSQYYAAYDNHYAIAGCIKTIKWNKQTPLPMEKIFAVSLQNLSVVQASESVWHIGRFAIARSSKSILLLKKLMLLAIAPVCESYNSIMLAECDLKLLSVLNLLGIKSTVLAAPIEYYFSLTVPIVSTKEDLLFFYNTNKHLIY